MCQSVCYEAVATARVNRSVVRGEGYEVLPARTRLQDLSAVVKPVECQAHSQN